LSGWSKSTRMFRGDKDDFNPRTSQAGLLRTIPRYAVGE
jgi:hypothetical protein